MNNRKIKDLMKDLYEKDVFSTPNLLAHAVVTVNERLEEKIQKTFKISSGFASLLPYL